MGIHAPTHLTPSAASCSLGHPAPFCPPWPQSPTRQTNPPTNRKDQPERPTRLHPFQSRRPWRSKSRSLGPLFELGAEPAFSETGEPTFSADLPFAPTPAHPCLQPARSDLHPNVTLHPAPLHRPLLPTPDSHSRHGNSTHFSTLFNTFRHCGVSFLVFLT